MPPVGIDEGQAVVVLGHIACIGGPCGNAVPGQPRHREVLHLGPVVEHGTALVGIKFVVAVGFPDVVAGLQLDPQELQVVGTQIRFRHALVVGLHPHHFALAREHVGDGVDQFVACADAVVAVVAGVVALIQQRKVVVLHARLQRMTDAGPAALPHILGGEGERRAFHPVDAGNFRRCRDVVVRQGTGLARGIATVTGQALAAFGVVHGLAQAHGGNHRAVLAVHRQHHLRVHVVPRPLGAVAAVKVHRLRRCLHFQGQPFEQRTPVQVHVGLGQALGQRIR